MTADPFAALDYPYDILLIRQGKGRMDQTTGEWVTPAMSALSLAGSFDPVVLEEDIREFGGVIDKGDARFFTEATLKEGDELRVHFDHTVNMYGTFLVMGVRANFGLLQSFGLAARYEYILKRMDTGVSKRA